MSDIDNQEWSAFADRIAEELLTHKVSEAVAAFRSDEEDRIVTNYFNMTFEKRWVMLGHLLTDLVLEVIETNADIVREMLDV